MPQAAADRLITGPPKLFANTATITGGDDYTFSYQNGNYVQFGALIGVFISVTTIPAAASIGVSIAFPGWGEARGSAPQLLLNVVVLIVVGVGGLTAQRRIWHWHTSQPPGL